MAAANYEDTDQLKLTVDKFKTRTTTVIKNLPRSKKDSAEEAERKARVLEDAMNEDEYISLLE